MRDFVKNELRFFILNNRFTRNIMDSRSEKEEGSTFSFNFRKVKEIIKDLKRMIKSEIRFTRTQTI